VADGVENLESLKKDYDNETNNITFLENELNKYKDVDMMMSSITEVKVQMDELEELTELNSAYQEAGRNIEKIQSDIDKIPNIKMKDIKSIKKLIEEVEILSDLKEQYEHADSNVKQVAHLFDVVKQTEDDCSLKLKNVKEEFTKYLKENNICPLCNRPLDEHAIEHIVGV
jgi:DNA repair exonuclease SbcCD ATPase subunit